MGNHVINDRSSKLKLPLPNIKNHQCDDVGRIRESFQVLDEHLFAAQEAIKLHAADINANRDAASTAQSTADTAKATADKAVKNTDNETIAGVKTFSSSPRAPRPTNESNDTTVAPTIWVRDMLKMEVEALSGGRNTMVRDVKNNPHIMVVIPRFNLQDIDAGLGSGIHPAFIINGVTKSEILVGKFLASKGSGDWVVTAGHKFPWVHINFDTALAKCRALGNNFGLCTHAVRSARALFLWKNFGEHYYGGNTYWGRDYTKPWQTGTMGVTNFNPGDTGNNDNTVGAATATGSGPCDWNDDGTPWGISDLVGNVWEWSAGIRTVAGEIQIIANNDAMMSGTNMTGNSIAWKAILMSNGSLVAPGTAGTLKYDVDRATSKTTWVHDGCPRLNTVNANVSKGGWQYCQLKDLTAASGVTAPALAKALGLWPMDKNVQGGLWTVNTGERLALAGGAWYNSTHCGPFALDLHSNRTYANWNVGFRPAYFS